MGGQTFTEFSKGKSAKEAFWDEVERAQIENGSGGYTGTIAEKHEFTMIPLPKGTEVTHANALAYAEKLIADDDKRIADKWGPAGCIDLGGDWYLFFGWASS